MGKKLLAQAADLKCSSDRFPTKLVLQVHDTRVKELRPS